MKLLIVLLGCIAGCLAWCPSQSSTKTTTATTTTVGEGTKPTVPPSGGCGVPAVKPNLNPQTIVGGTEAVPHSWPWQVAICGGPSEPCYAGCGASLITTEWVLSAAHCFIDKSVQAHEIHLKFGAHDYTTPVNNDAPIVRSVTKIVGHPQYTKPTRYSNDFVLLKLAEPVSFNDKIQPVCLPKTDSPSADEGNDAWVTGWGRLGEVAPVSKVLQQVKVPFYTNQKCKASYGGAVNELMICAGYSEGGKDSCYGDSGGPLVTKAANGKWYQHGVVSFGDGCARAGFPGVYARVTKYCDFMKETIGHDVCVN